MENEVDNLMATATEMETQIVGTFPQIIVTGTAEKPYFQIMYREGDEIHLGYGSFDLAYVFQWMEEFFGVTHASAVNPESLRPKGRWENYPSHMHRRCSICKVEWEKSRFNIRANYCPNCGADMRK